VQTCALPISAAQDLLEAGLVEGRDAGLERRDALGVDVEADDVVAELGHGGGVHGAEVSDSDDGESGGHRDMLLSRGTVLPSRGVVRPAEGVVGSADAGVGEGAEVPVPGGGGCGGRRDGPLWGGGGRRPGGGGGPGEGGGGPGGGGGGGGGGPAGVAGAAGAAGWARADGSRVVARVRAAVRQRGRKA